MKTPKTFKRNHRTSLAVHLAVAGAFLSGVSVHGPQGIDPIKPKHVYPAGAAKLAPSETVNGPARVLDLKGRKGINPTRIHTGVKMVGGHTWIVRLKSLPRNAA
ncbi:MAG: hypothetical protein MUF81_12140 [Verrucomicrobia bacterium]|jgi:hypothetical protein|nr:hypothetical protein [Verrucomicrobiota bacterium]